MTEQETEGRRTYYTGSSSQSNNGEEANFFLFNHRGDTVLITDQTGEVSNELYYEAYGKVTDQSGIPVNLSAETTPNLFVGAFGIRYDRKTELSYMRFRWYSINSYRFCSPDLINSINKYTYCSNNPINRIDYLGLWEIVWENNRVYAIPDLTQNYSLLVSVPGKVTPIVKTVFLKKIGGLRPVFLGLP